ncbi:MAG: lipid-A-disaccharide synthase [Chthoniobacterales bacterium]
MTLYFIAGEASADNHGAALMQSLRQLDADLRFVGRGGPQMKTIAGAQFNNWIERSGVLGLWEVIKHYGYFRKQFAETLGEIAQSKPAAVVLIDYPGFNLRLARVLHRQKTARKIIYYISPQVWAWNRGRIKKMARWLDLMLCIFPFEADLYSQSGLRAVFVGHPMIDRLRVHKIDIERDPNLIGLFPGSRLREVRKIFPILIETTRELRKQKPDLRFEVAAASPELAAEMKAMVHRLPAEEHRQDAAVTIKLGETFSIMQRAFVGIVASGSATLEAAYFGLPFVLVYKVASPTYLAARLVVDVKYLGMPNVLAGKEVVPEFIQHRARPRAIAHALSRLLNDDVARKRMTSDFAAVIASLGEGGASERAAKAILDELI